LNAPLFGVDDAAELRALAAADVSEPEQVPVECVRALAALGATRVEVRLGRRGFQVVAPGASLPEPLRAALDTALATAAPASERAHAVEEIAAGPAASLAVLLHPSVQAVRWTLAPPGLDVRLATLTRESARERLRAACRHSPRPILVDGALQTPRRPLDEFPSRALPAPERGRLTLLPESEAARATLLVHGIVRAVRPLPARLPFEVVLEVAGTGGEAPDPAALRDHADARSAAWDQLAASLLIDELHRPPTDPARDALLAALFLRGVEGGLAPHDWRRVPALVVNHDGRRVRASADEVEALGAEAAIAVLEPGGRPRGTVLEASVPVRAALSRLLGLRFEDVARHAERAPWRSRLRAAVDALWALAGRVAARTPLPARALLPQERALLAALQKEWPAYLVAGRGRPQRTRRGVALPRAAADVALAARGVQRDPGLLAAAVALLRPPAQRE
jgi:hypothetical protein